MKLNLKALGTLFGGLVVAMSGPVASAQVVTYATGTPNAALCVTGNDNDQNALIAAIKGASCANDPTILELYKAEVPNGESGPFADRYSTTFANAPTDPADATITYTPVGGKLPIFCSATEQCFLGVKDGAQVPAFYVYNISGWDGMSTIFMTGFWPNQGAISNVSIWSSDNGIIDDDDIPEPASLALVGIALLAAVAARRRRQA